MLLLVTTVNFAARRIPPSTIQVSLKMRKSKAAAVSVKMRKQLQCLLNIAQEPCCMVGEIKVDLDAHVQYFVTTNLHCYK